MQPGWGRGGIGVGFAYLAPITSLMQWFPRQKGLVTGLVVGGFGAGAAAIGQIAQHLMKNGATPYQVFFKLGFAYMVIAGVSGLALKKPPVQVAQAGAKSVHPEKIRFREVVCDRSFLILFFAMFSGLVAGFAIMANLKQLSSVGALSGSAAAISFFALANALGRIGWGGSFDRLGSSTRVVQANLAIQSILLFASPWLLSTRMGLNIIAIIAGLNYGGVLVLYASSVAARWGAQNVGHIYGWLFAANIPASAAPVLAGLAYDRWNNFTVPLLTAGVLMFVAVICLGFMPVHSFSAREGASGATRTKEGAVEAVQ